MRIVRLLLIPLCLLCLVACSEKTAIINGVDEREANEIVVFLASKGIAAEKQPAVSTGVGGGGGPTNLWNIYVDPTNVTEAMAILNRNGLPRKQGQDLLEIFGNTGLVPTDLQQKIRYQAGLAQQIANMIRQIDGVIDASVQLSIPQEEGQPVTASVYVKHQGVLDNPNSQLVTKIKQLVAGSVPGLKLENVTVISDRSRFTDVTVQGEIKVTVPEEEREYASVWGIWVAKSSLWQLRLFLLLICFLVIILVLALLWIIWRTLPMLKEKGGLSALWKVTPPPVVQEVKETPPPAEEKKEEPPKG